MSRDIAVLRDTLARYLPEGCRISALQPLATGHSNETYVIEGLDSILRLPPATASLLEAHGIMTQARIYEELRQRPGAPPAPGIRHICEDAGVLGDPFFVMERVPGASVNDYQLPEWFTSTTDEVRGLMCEQWVAAIAGIARLAPLRALGAQVSPQDEVRRWQAIAASASCPELVSLFDRLLGVPAPCSGPASPVHGDCKLANMMFADGRLSAVLDWELGYNGEPLSDLGYLLYFFANAAHPPALASREPGMWTRAQVIPAWESGSGRSAGGVEWYEVAATGKMAAILAQGYNLYASGQTDDTRFLRFRDKLVLNMKIMEAMLPAIEMA